MELADNGEPREMAAGLDITSAPATLFYLPREPLTQCLNAARTGGLVALRMKITPTAIPSRISSSLVQGTAVHLKSKAAKALLHPVGDFSVATNKQQLADVQYHPISRNRERG
ncbi:hypothetical protein E2P81_ATG11477 [Venturia nashicola]|nr:hypothetical protein E2P81_ATG11477 [Venturia nashicola]